MKKTLDHLPGRKQQDIHTIATIVRDARDSEHDEITVEELDYQAEEVKTESADGRGLSGEDWREY
ncbi:hypothetical protein SBX64_06325 [Vibrio rhizosphaerae]|uniref:Uncharacterized protein n=1 Tax=Vibrio rhizosphaerae TaxID=398736 RepID=A0ABU4ISP3_9VIBR|nr:hypothetical protein [Vibrio rhizosphaerae]MDW6092158.1 hypothetical protein [Vibrio rhizosphaerae]